MNILELGCGSGTFWTVNQDKLPPDINVTITDISEGMIRDAKRNITNSGLAQYNFHIIQPIAVTFLILIIRLIL